MEYSACEKKETNISLIMKFAVVEYSSKTGAIWKHSDNRPNYLCDPVHEIDPTSFGCYVSALKGEHIPLTRFIVGSQIHPITRIYRKIEKRLSGNWPANYDISYLKQFDALLVVYQISDGHEMVRFIKRIKKIHPKCVLLGVPTQPYGILKDHWNARPESIKELKDFMNACDVFLTIVKRTLPVWKKMTGTKVVYMPQPYPVDFASLKFLSREKKHNIIFVAGVTGRDNIAKGQIVAKKLQELLPRYRIHMAQIPGMDLDTKNLEGSKFDIIPFEPWQGHLGTLAKATLVINTDYTQTRGRVQADCAAVGTPSIGANSDGQDDLFPSLPGERETTIGELVAQGKRLLQDEAYYKEVMRTAKGKLEQYNYRNSKSRVEELVSHIRKEKESQ